MRILARHNRSLFFLWGIFWIAVSDAQSLLFPTDYLFDVPRQRALALDTAANIHTSVQPYIYDYVKVDTFKNHKHGADAFFDKLFYEDLIKLRHVDHSSGYGRKFNLDINPIVDFYYGKDLNDTATAKVQNNTRGFWLRGQIGNKMTFESAFMENQSFVPVYIYNFGRATGVVPGQGRWKKFREWGYDFAAAYGILNYAVNKNLTIRAGHGKQKIGNGYRSLLLSDNAFNYPYLQFIGNFFSNKLQYSQTYALLMNLTDGGAKTPPNTEPIFQKKAASFQNLSFRASSRFECYLFQGMIWKATDSTNTMHLDAFYANPVIFTNLIKYGFNTSINHVLGGGGAQLKIMRTLQLYGQFMYDGSYMSATGTSGNNTGVQAGIKYFDVFGIKNLFLQTEGNWINGYSYRSNVRSSQDYTHYGQALSTPASLPNELLGIISYSYKRLFVSMKYNLQYDNLVNGSVMNYFDGRIGYMINPNYKLNLSVGTTQRSYLSGLAGSKANEMQLFYVSLRTSIYNIYYDF